MKLLIFLFVEILSTNYLAIQRSVFDDCLKGVYTINNDVSGTNSIYNSYYKAWNNKPDQTQTSFLSNTANYKYLIYKRTNTTCTGEYNEPKVF